MFFLLGCSLEHRVPWLIRIHCLSLYEEHGFENSIYLLLGRRFYFNGWKVLHRLHVWLAACRPSSYLLNRKPMSVTCIFPCPRNRRTFANASRFFKKSMINPAIYCRFPLSLRLIRDFSLKITENCGFVVKTRPFQRFHRHFAARLIVRLYRDKIVDFHSHHYIANISRKIMISSIFSCHHVSNSISRCVEPL